MTLYGSRVAADIAAERLKIYAQPQRLMILSRLIDGEHTVSEIDEAIRIGQPALSQQLAALRRTKIVKTRRASKLVYYRLADDSVTACVRGIEAMFGGDVNTAGAVTTAPVVAVPGHFGKRSKGAAVFARIG